MNDSLNFTSTFCFKLTEKAKKKQERFACYFILIFKYFVEIFMNIFSLSLVSHNYKMKRKIFTTKTGNYLLRFCHISITRPKMTVSYSRMCTIQYKTKVAVSSWQWECVTQRSER